MTTYVNPYTGQTISPSQVSYQSLSIPAVAGTTSTTLSWPINGTTSSNVATNIIEVTATAANQNLVLPPATQVSVGQAIIIRNVGSGGQFSFNVVTNVANTVIVNIPLSASGSNSNTYYIYLTNNSTQNGTWSSVAMGIGTSSAVAGTLAGNGLIAIGNQLAENTPIQNIAGTYTFIDNDRANLFAWSGGSGTVTLPDPNTVRAGWFVTIKNNGTGILSVTAVGSGYSNLIDPSNPFNIAPGGSSSVQLQIANSSIFTTDGTYWYTYALAQTNVFNYTQLIVNVNSPALTSPYVMSAAFAKNVIQEFTGTLSANLLVLVPQTVQIYSFRNFTSGSYTLSFGVSNTAGTAAAGATISIPTNQALIVVSDGTDLYNANSAALSNINVLNLSNGTEGAPALTFLDQTTGFYSTGSGSINFSISGSGIGSLSTFANGGLRLTVGVQGGTF
jgi:hypothetical protein